MTIREAIDICDNLKPNQYSEEIKLAWLNNLDAQIHRDIIKTHEGWDGKDFIPYEDYDKELIVPFPYTDIYPACLKMHIDDENADNGRYNNSATMYNAYYDDFAKDYNKKHKPIGKRHLSLY